MSPQFIYFHQVKTNEDAVPYDPKEEDQKVTRENAHKGTIQLQHDCLRFLELFPDINAQDSIAINLRVAFPLAPSSDCEMYLTRKTSLKRMMTVFCKNLVFKQKC